ncbi:unnamed protein product [Caenorhabditis angaria]|uniref:Uncharacterized protein n=1 Tax=Caenorhabditis angaria TaxID=860376 RepID=A0A9P1IUK3_9PELO|nr:unnamed protein product [Caenorhabditis angaria]
MKQKHIRLAAFGIILTSATIGIYLWWRKNKKKSSENAKTEGDMTKPSIVKTVDLSGELAAMPVGSGEMPNPTKTRVKKRKRNSRERSRPHRTKKAIHQSSSVSTED